MNYGKREICRECAYAKEKRGGACYCTKYGIIIGYSKEQCRGYAREQVRQPQNNR